MELSLAIPLSLSVALISYLLITAIIRSIATLVQRDMRLAADTPVDVSSKDTLGMGLTTLQSAEVHKYNLATGAETDEPKGLTEFEKKTGKWFRTGKKRRANGEKTE